MNRFFVDKTAMTGGDAIIKGADAGHMLRVLRMKRGDRAALCDGEGYEYLSEISAADGDVVRLRVISKKRCESEPVHRITLYQGLPKAGKMEFIIQKCVELGVSAVVPAAAERSVVRVKPEEFQGRRTRYQRVAYEAAKQSGRGAVPVVGDITALADADMSAHDLVIIAYEEEKQRTLKSLLREHRDAKDIGLVIGPEGGLEKDEVEALVKKGGVAVTLGKRILRAETAGMAALAMILYEIEG